MIDPTLALDLAAVLTAHSSDTDTGHRVWTGDSNGRILRHDVQYTYRQAAHLIRTGEPAKGTVRTTCGTARCILHIADAGSIPGPPATPDPRWRDRAACLGHDMNLWFPEDHPDATGTAQAEAVAICAACPVRAHCLDDAMTAEGGLARDSRYGIRGGLTRWQRHREYQRRNHAAQRAA